MRVALSALVVILLALPSTSTLSANDASVDLGIIAQPAGDGTTPGEIAAIAKLSELVSTLTLENRLAVRWVDQFPSGYTSAREVTYERDLKTVTLTFLKTGVNETYSGVRPTHLAELADSPESGFYGLKRTVSEPKPGRTKKSLTEIQSTYENYLLDNTAVIEVHFESSWQIWVRLLASKYTSKSNVEQIARTIAAGYARQCGEKAVACTVWSLDASRVYAKGYYTSN